MFTFLYDKFTYDNMCQILSQSVMFCRLYIKNIFGVFSVHNVQGGPKKMAQYLCTPQLYHILIDFQNYFTARIRRKFVIILSLKVPPHLKCVATLLCGMSTSVLEATIINKMISVTTTYFKKLTTVNNEFIVSVIV